MKISWFSAGVSSAVATKSALKKYPDLRIIYTDIKDQHKDTYRFIADCEKWFGREVEVLRSSKYETVDQVCRAFSYIVGPTGAPCTRVLKRRVRTTWEAENKGEHTYIWGMDAGEAHRCNRIIAAQPKQKHEFPLIEAGLNKVQVHGIIESAGIKRPAMYAMGYPNNNCIGCVKGGKGYWVKIKKDFPEVFESRAKLERLISAHILKDCYLDELTTGGRELEIIVPDCGLFCEIPEGRRF